MCFMILLSIPSIVMVVISIAGIINDGPHGGYIVGLILSLLPFMVFFLSEHDQASAPALKESTSCCPFSF